MAQPGSCGKRPEGGARAGSAPDRRCAEAFPSRLVPRFEGGSTHGPALAGVGVRSCFFGYSPTFAGAPLADGEGDTPPAAAPNNPANAASDFITPGSISQHAIDAYVKAAMEADPIRVDWRGAAEWDELDPTLVRVPTLLIHAEFDPIATPEQRASLFHSLGTSDRESLEVSGADHMAFLESARPDFLKALVGFMERHQGA